MRSLLCVVTILLVASPAWAGQVLLEKGTGKLLAYSSRSTPGTMMDNARRAGRDLATVEEKTVTDAEWEVLNQQWVVGPNRQIAEAKTAARLQASNAVRTKLGLTLAEFEQLREALR